MITVPYHIFAFSVLSHNMAAPAHMQAVSIADVERAREAFFAPCHDAARALIISFLDREPDQPSEERDAAIREQLMQFAEEERKQRFLHILLVSAPRWVDLQWACESVKDETHFFAILYAWSVHAAPKRTQFEAVLSAIAPDRRYHALEIMMRLEDPGGRETEDVDALLTHALVNWPCQEDTEWMCRMMDLVGDHCSVRFLGVVLRKLTPPAARRFTAALFEQSYAPLIRHALGLQNRFVAALALIASMHWIDDEVKDAFEDAVYGSSEVVPAGARARLLQAIDCHNVHIQSMCFRDTVRFKRELLLDACKPDEKLATEALDATTVKKELQVIACKLCFENRVAICFRPCGHVVCCNACFARIAYPQKCPTCRTPVEAAQSCFL